MAKKTNTWFIVSMILIGVFVVGGIVGLISFGNNQNQSSSCNQKLYSLNDFKKLVEKNSLDDPNAECLSDGQTLTNCFGGNGIVLYSLQPFSEENSKNFNDLEKRGWKEKIKYRGFNILLEGDLSDNVYIQDGYKFLLVSHADGQDKSILHIKNLMDLMNLCGEE